MTQDPKRKLSQSAQSRIDHLVREREKLTSKIQRRGLEMGPGSSRTSVGRSRSLENIERIKAIRKEITRLKQNKKTKET